jgi:hypothetical protein
MELALLGWREVLQDGMRRQRRGLQFLGAGVRRAVVDMRSLQAF